MSDTGALRRIGRLCGLSALHLTADRVQSSTSRPHQVMIALRISPGVLFRGVALGVVAAVSLTSRVGALNCSDLTPAEIEVLPPPGVCDPATHAQLEADKDAACSPVSRCVNGELCSSISAKLSAFNACIDARLEVMNVCFCGGNSGHRIAVHDLQNGARRCQDILLNKQCRDCP